MKVFKNITCLFLVFPVFLKAQIAPTLQELIDAALKQDATIEQQKLSIEEIELEQEKLKDLFLPKIELSGKYGYTYNSAHITVPGFNVPAIPPVFPGAKISEKNNAIHISGFLLNTKAEASVLIYSGGKVKFLAQALGEKELSHQALLNKSEDEVVTKITEVYDLFALLQANKKVLDESKKRLEENKKTADKALSYGLITAYDHKKIELAQATLDSKMVEYEGKKELVISQMQILTGIERERITSIQPDLQPIDYQTWSNSIENRAEIQALQHGIKAAEYKIKAEKQWWQPKVQAVASLAHWGLYGNRISSSENIATLIPKKLDLQPENINLFPAFQIGVGFKWDIFDGKEGKTATKKAEIDKAILESKKADAMKKLNLNLQNNQTNYNIAKAQIQLKAKAKEIAENALKQVEKEFRYGLKKSVDLVEAEDDLEKAELEYQTAIFNQRRAAIELMKSVQDLNVKNLYE